jgi:hypothetical protein
MAFIVVDFDGTCVTHTFPGIGDDIRAVPVLKELVKNGHELILFTMRSNKPELDQFYLLDAIEWFKNHDIPLFGIQTNPTQKKWTTSPKAYGQLIIDDAALGCPLLHHFDEGFVKNPDNRPHVDWKRVREELVRIGYIK